MRKELLIDLLTLCGFVLIGAGVWLAFGLAAMLGYAGSALLVVTALLAVTSTKRERT